jgi:hypothetical protein
MPLDALGSTRTTLLILTSQYNVNTSVFTGLLLKGVGNLFKH